MSENLTRYGMVLILCLLLLGACGEEPDSGRGSGCAMVESSGEIVADNSEDHESDNVLEDGSTEVFEDSDEDEDSTLGYISIENGTFDICAGADGIQAATDIIIADGEFNTRTAGDSSSSVSSDATAKGIKATVSISIDGGGAP